MKSIKKVLCPAIVALSLSGGVAFADAKSDAMAACDAGKSAMGAAKKAGMLWTLSLIHI